MSATVNTLAMVAAAAVVALLPSCHGEDPRVPKWIEEARSEREKLMAADPGFFAEVSRLLFDLDPMGINFTTNTDEYDAEAGTIIPRLAGCTSEADATRIVHEEFIRWFGADTAGPIARYKKVGARLWTAWQARQRDAS